jgi:hypothetical protein
MTGLSCRIIHVATYEWNSLLSMIGDPGPLRWPDMLHTVVLAYSTCTYAGGSSSMCACARALPRFPFHYNTINNGLLVGRFGRPRGHCGVRPTRARQQVYGMHVALTSLSVLNVFVPPSPVPDRKNLACTWLFLHRRCRTIKMKCRRRGCVPNLHIHVGKGSLPIVLPIVSASTYYLRSPANDLGVFGFNFSITA